MAIQVRMQLPVARFKTRLRLVLACLVVALVSVVLSQFAFAESTAPTRAQEPDESKKKGPPLFLPYVKYAQGLDTHLLAVGKLNHDNRRDVLALSMREDDTADLKIFYQNKDGTLELSQKLHIGYPGGLAVGDLNGDGYDDIVAGQKTAPGIAVYIQQLDSTWAAPVNYETPETISAVAMGDVNHDGRADVVVAGGYPNNFFGVFLQTADSTLDSLRPYPSRIDSSGDIGLGDLNGDGLLDVVKFNYGSFIPLQVYLQREDGTLADPIEYDFSMSAGMAVGDLNQDGRAEVVLTSLGNDGIVSIIALDSEGQLSLQAQYKGGNMPGGVEFMDMNLDSLPDLIILNDGEVVQVLLQEKDGTFYNTGYHYILPWNSYDIQNLVVGDLNRDGAPDVAVGNDGLNVLYHVDPKHPLPPTPTKTPKPKPVWLTITEENFEGGFPRANWQVTEGWGKSMCQAYTGRYAGWAIAESGLPCTDDYPPDAYNWLIYGPFSLRDAKHAYFDFSVWLDAEYQHDYLFVGASREGQKFYGRAYTGRSGGNMPQANGEMKIGGTERPHQFFPVLSLQVESPVGTPKWVRLNFSLDNMPAPIGTMLNRPQVWIGFLWATDAAGAFPAGAFVDDVILKKQMRR